MGLKRNRDEMGPGEETVSPKGKYLRAAAKSVPSGLYVAAGQIKKYHTLFFVAELCRRFQSGACYGNTFWPKRSQNSRAPLTRIRPNIVFFFRIVRAEFFGHGIVHRVALLFSPKPAFRERCRTPQ